MDEPTEKLTVVVAGDVVVDHHLYEGNRKSPTHGGDTGVVVAREPGGACTVYNLVNAIVSQAIDDVRKKNDAAAKEYEVELAKGNKPTQPKSVVALEAGTAVQLGVLAPERDGKPSGHHAYAVWKPYAAGGGSKDSYWRTSLVMGYGHGDISIDLSSGKKDDHPGVLKKADHISEPDILVLDDAAFLFRHRFADDCWLLRPKGKLKWIVVKIAPPVAQGDLWAELLVHHSDQLVCVVAAADIRKECV